MTWGEGDLGEGKARRAETGPAFALAVLRGGDGRGRTASFPATVGQERSAHLSPGLLWVCRSLSPSLPFPKATRVRTNCEGSESLPMSQISNEPREKNKAGTRQTGFELRAFDTKTLSRCASFFSDFLECDSPPGEFHGRITAGSRFALGIFTPGRPQPQLARPGLCKATGAHPGGGAPTRPALNENVLNSPTFGCPGGCSTRHSPAPPQRIGSDCFF